MTEVENDIRNELMHYGILGMKWGQRRFQNEDRTWTEAGKKRYYTKVGQNQTSSDVKKRRLSEAVEKAKENVNVKKQEHKDLKITGGTDKTKTDSLHSNKLRVAKLDKRYAKEDLRNSKILEKLGRKEKSKTQLKLEAKYKAKGLSDEEAAIAAYNNIKTRKILAVAGTVSVAAIAGYATYKYKQGNLDTLIKADSLLQTISADSNQGVRDAFYASIDQADHVKYEGYFARGIESKGGTPYKKTIQTLQDLKQVSSKNAQKTLSEIASKDPEFKREFLEYIKNPENRLRGSKYEEVYNKAISSLSKGKVDQSVYDVFNATMVDHRPSRQAMTDTFFKALSDKGYNAIKDVNDAKYSGYKALNPVITFNSSNKVKVINVEQLAKDHVAKSHFAAFKQIAESDRAAAAAQEVTKKKQSTVAISAGIAAGVASGAGIVQVIKTASTNQKIEKYRKEHPNTKKTNTEIIRSIEKGNIK